MTDFNDLVFKKSLLQAAYNEKTSKSKPQIETDNELEWELFCLVGQIIAYEDLIGYYEIDKELGFYDSEEQLDPPLGEDEMTDLDEPIPL